ncbi:MAG: DUF2934 domain-containing protein [Burkholderiales bacterium]|nr:DUF2934 domain-containing protein [Burkholderiales bacterium]
MPNTPTRTPKTKAGAKAAVASKPATRAPAVRAKAKKGTAEAQPSPALNAQERQRLIEQAAYFRAERRGFAPGFEMQDWIEAEAEVLRLIGTP